MSPFLSSRPSGTCQQLTHTSSLLCQCCHLLQFHHLFSLSLSISDLSDVGKDTAAHTKKTLGCPIYPTLSGSHKNTTLPQLRQNSQNSLHFPIISIAAASSTLEDSSSLPYSHHTAWNASVPIPHSTHYLYKETAAPTWVFLWTPYTAILLSQYESLT